MTTWNPWHGCHKYSEGCKNCYVYRIDTWRERDASIVYRNEKFDFPIQKNRKGEYKISSGDTVYTCFSSDFFLEDADIWREEAWDMIFKRGDVNFYIPTKRINRFLECVPFDWGSGYDNVIIACTVENQRTLEERLPIFKELPICHKEIICEPLLEKIDLSKYIDKSWVDKVIVGGESGDDARVCDYDWILDIRRQCIEKNIPFCFKQTGANFKMNGKIYNIKRKNQIPQAQKAGIDIE